MNYLQQGDVLLFPVATIPKTAKTIEGATLALGEFTGHHHTLFDTIDAEAPATNNPYTMGSASVKLFELENVKYAQVMKGTYLKHQEHKPIYVEPGLYKIGIVREVDPFSDEIRAVAD